MLSYGVLKSKSRLTFQAFANSKTEKIATSVKQYKYTPLSGLRSGDIKITQPYIIIQIINYMYPVCKILAQFFS